MKKLLFLVTMLLLAAAPAMAAIATTAHDLSGDNAGTNDEICVYCHTPHGADITVTLAPLWNRSTTTVAATLYQGVAIDATMTQASINQTDAPLCLSCHDGTVAETLKNEPNNNGPTDLSGYSWGSGPANLTTNMNNDHPIGFDFTAVAGGDAGTGPDAEIHDKPTVEAVGGMSGALSYGGGDDMWCSSCHDVHDNSNPPFLRMSNASSALCTTCHIK